MNDNATLPDSDRKLKDIFREYYATLNDEIPDLMGSREIGFIPFGGTMVRHRALKNRQELNSFLTRIVPRHLYHSVAYYDDPTNRSMQAKKWKGAELIFDLDADHIEGASKMTYMQILDEVKKHTLRLLNTFLRGMMGIPDDSIKLYFSGGRGYHVHVQQESIYSLDSNSRREISNLVRGEGLSLQSLLSTYPKDSNESRGWLSILDNSVTEVFSSIRSGADAYESLRRYFPRSDSARRYAESLSSLVKRGNVLVKKIDILCEPGLQKYRALAVRDTEVASEIANAAMTDYKCEIDEPVTTDLHRLIRFPGSLHGKSGLAVTRIGLDALPGFNPLNDAIPAAFSDKEDRITVNRKLKISMKDEEFELEGDAVVPRYLAVFAVAGKFGSFT